MAHYKSPIKKLFFLPLNNISKIMLGSFWLGCKSKSIYEYTRGLLINNNVDNILV